MPRLLGLDIGSTTIKAAVLDSQRGRLVELASVHTPVEHPRPGWSQHDPISLRRAVAGCLRRAAGCHPQALAVSSLAEAGVALDSRDQPLYPIIAWYDRRNESQVRWWEARMPPEAMHAITGQRVNTSFSVTKLQWLLENEPQRMANLRHWLSLADYLLWWLSGERATSPSIASRSLLFDQRSGDWSQSLLDLAGVDRAVLPPVHPSGSLVGKLTPQAAAESGLPAGLPCFLGGHDHLCAALAVGGISPGTTVDSSGTAESLLMVLPSFHTGAQFAAQGFACNHHVVPGKYILKGGMKAAGGAIEWLLRLLTDAQGDRAQLPYAALEQEARAGVGRRAGPLWLPHLLGAGTPESDWRSRAALVGVQGEHERGDLLRGLLESLALWFLHNLTEMQSLTQQELGRVLLLGGTTRLRLLTELKADVLNHPVWLPQLPEAAASGAALLAGFGAGVYHSLQEGAASLDYAVDCIQPDEERAAWYAQIYQRLYLPLYPALRDINHAMTEMSTPQAVDQ